MEFIGRSAARITDWFYGDIGESERDDQGEDEIGTQEYAEREC